MRCGGGTNHRFGLDDAMLIKDNHKRLAGGITAAVTRALAASTGLRVEVEVETLDELDEALAAGATSVLLDNFTTYDLRRAVDRVAGRARVEVSGGVTLDRLPEIASTGAETVSIGALTHSAPAVDLELRARTGAPLIAVAESVSLPAGLADAMAAARPRFGGHVGEIVYVASLPSTMDAAASLAEAGGGHGLVVIAGHQTAGRGRRGHTWSSPVDAGLYFSTVVRPPLTPYTEGAPSLLGLLTLAAGLAVAEGVGHATGLEASLKWPNDLFYGYKLAGVLAEGHRIGSADQHVVVGVGINIRDVPYVSERERATSIERELGRVPDAGLVLAEVLAAWAARYQDLLDGRYARDRRSLAHPRDRPGRASGGLGGRRRRTRGHDHRRGRDRARCWWTPVSRSCASRQGRCSGNEYGRCAGAGDGGRRGARLLPRGGGASVPAQRRPSDPGRRPGLRAREGLGGAGHPAGTRA